MKGKNDLTGKETKTIRASTTLCKIMTAKWNSLYGVHQRPGHVCYRSSVGRFTGSSFFGTIARGEWCGPAMSIVDGSWSPFSSALSKSKSVNVVQHSLNHVFVLSSFAPCHQLRHAVLNRICRDHGHEQIFTDSSHYHESQ